MNAKNLKKTMKLKEKVKLYKELHGENFTILDIMNTMTTDEYVFDKINTKELISHFIKEIRQIDNALSKHIPKNSDYLLGECSHFIKVTKKLLMKCY